MTAARHFSPGAGRRALWVAGILLVALVAARHLLLRSGASPASDGPQPAVEGEAGWDSPAPSPGERTRLIRAARQRLMADGGEQAQAKRAPAIGAQHAQGAYLALVSLSRADRTALVARAAGSSYQQAVLAAVDQLSARAGKQTRAGGRLKIDLVQQVASLERFDPNGRARLDPSLEGLWLAEVDLMLLPEELVSRRLLDRSGDLQSGRLRRYLAEGGRAVVSVRGNPGRSGKPYRRLRFDSFAEADEEVSMRLFRGNDRAPNLAPGALLAAAKAGGAYLREHQHQDGNFDYQYDPRRDRLDKGYNLLRHAGSCYALVELYRETSDTRDLEAARRGIEALLEHVRGPRPGDAAADFEAIVSPGEEAKLGGAALAVLAIVAYQQASDDPRFLPHARKLGRFLLHQQAPNGRFASKYFYAEPDAEPFDSIYYPGEAILALARLHALAGGDQWLDAARRGADYLIDVRDGDLATDRLPHDHWLLIGLDALDAGTGDARYVAHAARIAEAIVGAQRTTARDLDWIGTFYNPPRSTPTATRAEALVAMHRLAQRHGRDSTLYHKALLRMAAFQLRCQFRAVNALYLPHPERAIGGFRRSLEDWRVRIDYVQHNLSALLGLRALLEDQAPGTSFAGRSSRR